MKSFKEYSEAKKKVPFLSWDSGFSEVREKKVTENWHGLPQKQDSTGNNKFGQNYDAGFHDHPDVKPRNVSDDHARAILRYTTTSSNGERGHASSGNMNAYLRNKAGDKTQRILHDHDPKKVHDSIKTLSSAFTKENTNKKAIHTYGGVPAHIGEKLEKSEKGSEHHLAGFTSTSSAQRTAKHFAHTYNGFDPKKVKHVIHYHVKPGAGLSAVHHTDYNENEVILHHGAKLKYSHTTVHKGTEGEGDTHVHHVVVGSKHKKIEDYGDYEA
jgi:hypothetical protein